MIHSILAGSIISLVDFKKNPMVVVDKTGGFPIAVLHRNKPAFYCIPAEAYELLVDKLEDMELSGLVSARKGQPETVINIDGLKSAEKRIYNR